MGSKNKPDWIKLDVEMFSNPKIKELRRMPEGNNIILIWVMLLTIAGKCNAGGLIMITQNIPYRIESLADELKFDIQTVEYAINVLENFGMIHVNDYALEIASWHEYQNIDGLEKIRENGAKRQARYREKQKLLQNKSDVTSNVTSNVSVTHLLSYSISYNNIINTNNILSIYKDKYIYINNNKDIYNSILEWMEYKDNCKPKSKHHYGTELGLCKLLTQIQTKAMDYGDEYVIDCIDNSIAHTWVGIMWDKDVPKIQHVENVTEKSDWQ